MSKLDTRVFPDIGKTARALGWFSVGLGVMELLAGRKIGRAVGQQGHIGTVRLFGVREIATGVALLQAKPAQHGVWLWARVAGDALDLLALARGTFKRPFGAGLAAIIVAGVTVIDIAAASQASDQGANLSDGPTRR